MLLLVVIARYVVLRKIAFGEKNLPSFRTSSFHILISFLRGLGPPFLLSRLIHSSFRPYQSHLLFRWVTVLSSLSPSLLFIPSSHLLSRQPKDEIVVALRALPYLIKLLRQALWGYPSLLGIAYS